MGKATLCGVQQPRRTVSSETGFKSRSPNLARLRISLDGAYFDSLARLRQEKLQADPFSDCLFVFRSRRGISWPRGSAMFRP